MEFIEKSFESLVGHLIDNGLEAKQDSFKLIDSISSTINNKKINLFLLGVLVNREKTPKNKIYREGREYKAGENFFEIYFAITLSNLNQYAKILRILCDFEEDKEKNRYRLLNSSKELKDATLVEHFLSLKNDKGVSISANAVFVRVEKSVITLQTLPKTTPVRDIKTKIKRKQ
jgi:hypothetical protein